MEDIEEEVKEYFDRNGLTGIEEFLKQKLEEWKNVEITIGVAGDSGAGKSRFINAIRGLADDDEGAAKTGVTETTTEPTIYSHPTNEKIKFVDLPGIGTSNYPDIETYCERVDLKKYDTFLIFTATRFTGNNLKLAKVVVENMKKSFFFVRTKIDQDIKNESRKKAFNEESTLNGIREDCVTNLKGLTARDKDVFLISSEETAKWDFYRLTEAILDVLPSRKKESLTLSLNLLTIHCREFIGRKVQVLQGRIWMVAAASATVSVSEQPQQIDSDLLKKEVNFYISQLGLPEENSKVMDRQDQELKEKLRLFWCRIAQHIGSLLKDYASDAINEFSRYIPLVGSTLVGAASFSTTYWFLNDQLKKIGEIALEYLTAIETRVGDEIQSID